jgi:hypothetical protein
MDRIRDILMPREFTRVDGIIDLVFSATKEAKQEETPEETSDELEEEASPETKEKKFTPVTFRAACIPRLESQFGQTLVKQSSALYATPDERLAVLCATSREYNRPMPGYWFAFHPSQKKVLEEYDEAWICFGCGSENQLLLVPLNRFVEWLPLFNKTESENRSYWHVHINKGGEEWELNTKGGQAKISLTEFYLVDHNTTTESA